MARVFDLIEFLDQRGDNLVQRFPADGSGDLRLGSQLVVRENQWAIMFRDGKALDAFGPGRHTLTTLNVPLLIQLLGALFDGKSPFRAEVYFVNRKVFTNLKWGTPEPIPFRDAELQLVRLRAFGIYSMRVDLPQLFLNTLVGTQGLYTSAQVQDYLRGIIVARLADFLGENLKSVFDLAARYDEVATATKARLAEDFDKYGLELVDLFVNAITPPPEVQKMIDERAGMGAVGNLNAYMQFKAAKAMEAAATAGGGEGGGAAGTGVGLGAGIGLGMMLPQMLNNAFRQGTSVPLTGVGAVQVATCPSCAAAVPIGAKFCPACGGKLQVGAVPCAKCGNEVPPGAKFCPNCGAQRASASRCSHCGAELPSAAKFCPACGKSP
jgi:membrane protease subunit (stomatin/prohibitin family)